MSEAQIGVIRVRSDVRRNLAESPGRAEAPEAGFRAAENT
jgi:hypothetical protein